MAYTDQEKQKWVEIAQDTGSSIEGGAPVLKLNELDTTVSIPGVKFSSISYDEEGNVTGFGTPESYAQLPLGTLAIKTRAAQDAADAANTAAARAETAADGAENVDASLVGMTITITDRQGVSRSVNIGFEIYRVYGSVAAMKADAANVPYGAFVMIATADPISTENAQLWARNAEPSTSANPFTFLSDLDQAATHVWDDWNTNLRQAIVNATQDALDAAALANTKASLAQTAADNADASRLAIEANEQTRQQNETTRQQNEQGRVTAESQRVTDWNNFFSDTLATGCRKLWNDFWSLINTSWNGFWGTSETDPNGVRKQWADLKADAQADHATAQADHSTAVQDHTTATQDHTTAVSDHTTATQDHSESTQATQEAVHQTEILESWNENPPYVGEDNFWYIYDTTTQQYVKSNYAKGDDLHWDEMSEQEKEDLSERVLAELVFATVETCEDIIDELT